ncbi:MAG: hypothetical protein FWC28_07365 [Proteobacteria bacterium]|nr:hypothetical protein [Pseudomonadota bacterium]
MRPFFIASWWIAVFILSGCGGGGAKAPAVPQTVKSPQGKSTNASVNANTNTSSSAVQKKTDESEKTAGDSENNDFFSMGIPRDPFLVDQSRQVVFDDVAIEDNLCEELLCGFEIAQLLLVAVISGDANPVAMLEDTQGMGYIVRKNSRIGKYGGRVSNIYQNCLIITEPSQDFESGIKDITLCVKSESTNSTSVDLMTNRQIQ